MIVEYLICLEESYNYQEAHQGEVKSIEAELSLKISGDSYDHLSEGKHDIRTHAKKEPDVKAKAEAKPAGSPEEGAGKQKKKKSKGRKVLRAILILILVLAAAVAALVYRYYKQAEASLDLKFTEDPATVEFGEERRAMDRVSELLDLDANGIASFMSSPVALDEEAIFPVANYGSGVAPFYTNLALWVGGFVLIAIYKAEVDDEGIDGGFEPWQGYFGRLLLFLLLGVLQGVICTVGDLVIGIQCLDPKAFVLAGVIESFVYVNVIFAFAVAFKHIGKALCVLLVILQIPGSSGTYPIEMMPGFFRALNPWLPFTYGIRAMREAIAGYYGNYYGHNLFMLLLFLIPALLIGVGWRRHLLNINSLFDKKLAETDLIICERDGIEVEHYRLSSLIKALMHNDEYRTQLLQRAARFNAAYPHLIRVGFVLLLALPLGLSVVMFSASNKLPWFIVWIVCLVLLCTALIIIEYFHESLTRKTAMVDLTKDEMYQLLGDQLDREYFSSPIERLRRRMSDAVAEAHQARQAAEDFAASAEASGEAAGAQTTLVLRRLIDGPHLAGRDQDPEVEVPTIVRGGAVTPASAAADAAEDAASVSPTTPAPTDAATAATARSKGEKDHRGHKKHDKVKADKDKKRKKDKRDKKKAHDKSRDHEEKDRKHKHGKKGDKGKRGGRS